MRNVHAGMKKFNVQNDVKCLRNRATLIQGGGLSQGQSNIVTGGRLRARHNGFNTASIIFFTSFVSVLGTFGNYFSF